MSTVAFSKRFAPLATEKELPKNLEAERCVLGSILLDDSIPNATLKSVTEKMNSSDFWVKENQCIFRHMLALAESKAAINTVTLVDHLHSASELEKAGGAGYISGLPDGIPHISHALEYARLVREKSILRQLIEKTHQVQQAAFDGNANYEALLGEMEEFSRSAASGRRSKLVAVGVRDFLTMNLGNLEYVIEPLLTVKGRGMIYAPRGGGKTFVTMQIAHSIATGQQSCFVWNIPKKRPVVYVDGEMHGSMLQERQREIERMNGLVVPTNEELRLITRDLQTDVRPKINTKEGRDQLAEHLSPGDVLILDNLSALSPSSDEKETEDWALIEDWLSHLSWHGITTMFVNHAGKSGDQRGTSKREDLLDFVLKLRVPNEHTSDEGLRAEIHLTKIRGKVEKPVWGQPFEVRLGMDEHGGTAWMIEPLRELLKARARQMLIDGTKASDVSMETGLSRWAVARLVRDIRWGKENDGKAVN